MKKVLILLMLIMVSLVMGCAKTAEPDASDSGTLTVVVPKSPAAIPLLRMTETNALGEKEKIDLQFYTDMDKMIALASGNEYDFLAVPVHTAAALYNKGLDVKLLNVILWGGMYLSTSDSDCNKWEDLKGKQLFIPAQGSVPDIVTQYFLSKHGLKIGEDVEAVYSNHAEISQLIISGQARYAIDVEPFATSHKENVQNYRIISDFAEEWEVAEGNAWSMPNFGLVINNNTSQDTEKTKTFCEELAKATDWVLDNPDEAGALAEKYLNANSQLIEKAVPTFHFNYQASIDAREDIEKYYAVLLNFKPETVGGKIPDEDFYYKK